VDPRTLERVIPESKRLDGTVRKEKKIRPGFTPQEDVRRFRGTKQAEMDARQLPKGHIIGWAPPGSDRATSNKPVGAGLSKSQKKNQKRKDKRETELSKKIKESWEDDDDDDDEDVPSSSAKKPGSGANSKASPEPSAESEASGLAEKLEDLNL